MVPPLPSGVTSLEDDDGPVSRRLDPILKMAQARPAASPVPLRRSCASCARCCLRPEVFSFLLFFLPMALPIQFRCKVILSVETSESRRMQAAFPSPRFGGSISRVAPSESWFSMVNVAQSHIDTYQDATGNFVQTSQTGKHLLRSPALQPTDGGSAWAVGHWEPEVCRHAFRSMTNDEG